MYLFAARKVYSKILFSIMAAHSFMSAFVLYGTYDRPMTFLAYADLYCALFFFLNSAVKEPGQPYRPREISLFWCALALTALCGVAASRFGPLYAVVEFRPYLTALLLVAAARLFRLRLNVIWAGELLATFIFWELIFIAANYAVKAHKLGIFGEMNYDVQFFIVGAIARSSTVRIWHVLYAVAAKTSTFLIYSAGVWAAQRRGSALIGLAMILIFMILLYGDYISLDLATALTQDLDRIFIAQRFIQIVLIDSDEFALCGQLFCGGLLYDAPLSWYIETQRLSSTLNSVVPAVFHGHLLRNMFMLGIPLALLLYGWLAYRLSRNKQMTPLVIWIFASGISQSIAHHPFVGILLVIAISQFLQDIPAPDSASKQPYFVRTIHS